MKLALFAVVLVLFFATGVITLLGIIQRVQIERKYLNALFSTLVLELVAAVLFMFSATDFFAFQPISDAQANQLEILSTHFPDKSVSEIESSFVLLTEFESRLSIATSDKGALQSDIKDLTVQRDQLELELIEKSDQIQWLNNELNARKEAIIRMARLERQFLVRMSELNQKIGEWGTSINLRWQSDEKRDIALMLQEAFKEIGFMKELEIPNDDPLLAHEILIRYQLDKKFKEIGFLTPQVVAFIIQDYLGPLQAQATKR